MDPSLKPKRWPPPRFLDSPLRLLAVAVEAMLEKAKRTLRYWQGRAVLPATIKKHNAIRFPGGVILQGRVMAARRLRRPRVDDSAWVNLARMLRHWLTDEEPYAKVEAECAGVVRTTHADGEGYFEILFDHPEVAEARHLKMRLPEVHSHRWREIGIFCPPADFDYLVFSDIDDTILETNAASVIKMIRTTLFGNVLTRQVFPGTTELFAKLTRGGNPVFYVTSSPWNLRGFIQSVFERHDLPSGGFFMTDWGLDKERWFSKCHRRHKIGAIERVLRWYPGAKAILVGDSGQLDPEIYKEVAERNPGRIDLVLIRKISRSRRRLRKVEEFARQMEERGTHYCLCRDSDEMAERFEAAKAGKPGEPDGPSD